MQTLRYDTWLSRAVLVLFFAGCTGFFAGQQALAQAPTGYDRASGMQDDPRVDWDFSTFRGGPIEGDWSESFENIETLPEDGWFMQNNSEPIGVTDWFQGSPDVFPAHTGDADHYIGANFNNTAGVGTISNWLLTPEMVIQNGTTISFFTRTVEGSQWADRLQFRLSVEGESTNVGTGATDVGDFTILLVDVNEQYTLGGYPETWTELVFEMDGFEEATTGRFAWRYFVENGGPAGTNSNFIGIDEVVVEQPKISSEGGATQGSFSLSSVYPNPVSGVSRIDIEVGSAQHVSVEVFNLLGQRVATIFDGMASAGSNVVNVDATSWTAGMYVVRVVGEGFSQSRRFVVSH